MDIKTTSRRRFLAGMVGTGLGALSHTAVFGKINESKDEKGFVPLFNGKDLQGWHTNVQKIVHGHGGSWKVENGAITGEQDPPDSGNGGILMTDRAYGDFELLLELAPDWGIDSGVFLRTNPQGECFQVYVDYHDHGNVGWISTETSTGQKRMIIRPFNIFGKMNDQNILTGFTTKPDEREITWFITPNRNTGYPPGRSDNGIHSAFDALENTLVSRPGSTTRNLQNSMDRVVPNRIIIRTMC